jgi:superfamily I DNA/RNA helicase
MDKVLDFLHKKYEKWKSDCKTINDILKKIKEHISSTDNSIKLSTIHRAKGIESYRVFILNYDELPYIRTDFKEWQCKQEINLKYVAITRAINELYLVENKNFDDMVEEESLFDNLPFDQSI